MDPEIAFSTIAALPGMGPKSALCVLMYSFKLDAFPVDVNVQRIAERMGIISPNLKHYQAQRKLALVVPEGMSTVLHVGMVVHGRKVCLPRNPKCNHCKIRTMCRFGKEHEAKEHSSVRRR